MMRLLLLSHPEVNPEARRSLLRAFGADGWDVVEVPPERVRVHARPGEVTVAVLGLDSPPDAVVGRTVARYLDLLRPAIEVWQDSGIPVLNGAWATRMGRDKLAAAVALARAGLPVVPTVGVLPDVATVAAPQLPDGLGVVKPARGHSGQLVTQLADRSAAAAFWPALGARASQTAVEPAVAQPLVAGVGDVRAYVVAGRCVGIMRRRPAAGGEWRANARLGGHCTALPPDHPGARLAERAAAALDLDAAGVDLIGPDDALQILEVDGWAGFDNLAATTGADVPAQLSAHLRAVVHAARAGHAARAAPAAGAAREGGRR